MLTGVLQVRVIAYTRGLHPAVEMKFKQHLHSYSSERLNHDSGQLAGCSDLETETEFSEAKIHR